MTCPHCQTHWFWKKIGRCQRCMDQLTALSVICWLVWWFAFREQPKSIQSIALLVAGFGFNALLFLHLWMRFVILPLRKRRGLSNQDDQE
ncbi:DUF3624 domain-containing protein [Vibrio xiamenensis]|uniref:DUF3624 domain-containing protein n=1 Tax=Vibrio xiamenensis TaxID=861298 RepID=UPI000B20F285|nr:DUF3624 domain-containing protein [Vibrio xiamenensis]